MTTPVLHLLAGPNGSGKSTFVELILQPATHLPFINADVIAAETWPGDESAHAYDASRLAAEARDEAIGGRRSFISETVFSHPSKLDLVTRAVEARYLVELHVMLVPEDLAVARVTDRVHAGGHSVPETKIRERYRRLWPLVARARRHASRAHFYDNTTARSAFTPVAEYEHGRLIASPIWPAWTPPILIDES